LERLSKEIHKSERGYKEGGYMEDGGMMADGGQVHYDLFVVQDKIPQKVQDVLDDYVEYGEDITYEQLMSMQRDMERVGYTFDFGLDAIPYGLRPLGVDIDELQEYEENEYSDAGYYAHGGMMTHYWVIADDKRGELYVFNDGYYNTQEEAKDALNKVKIPKIVDANTVRVEAVPTNPNYIALFNNLSMMNGGMTAGRGRLLSALNRDRAYMSSQEWEKNYKRKGSPKKPKYNTSYAVGGQAKVKQYPDLSNTKPTVIN
jgi:hypothetical protein